MAPLLRVESSTKRFGGLAAIRDVSLAMEAGEIVGLIGRNGAGKTTLFNCITGYMHPDDGRIVFEGRDITHTRPERICRLGVARTWQVVRAFGRMTALENVVCGALERTNRVVAARARATELLEFTELRGKDDAPAATLTLADKKRLEIARALATRPKLLLLDEAMSGLTPIEAAAAVRLVRRIHAGLEVTMCVGGHVVEGGMPLSHRVGGVEYGVKIADGLPQANLRDVQGIPPTGARCASVSRRCSPSCASGRASARGR